jgi:hypothetical protein
VTLREQVRVVGERVFGRDYVTAVSFPTLVDALCVRAFAERWPEGTDTHALRRAEYLLRSVGCVDVTEPGSP